MTPDLSDFLEGALDRFEARVRRKWSYRLQHLALVRRDRIRDAMVLDDPRAGIGALKPSLSEYDGHIETHGQD